MIHDIHKSATIAKIVFYIHESVSSIYNVQACKLACAYSEESYQFVHPHRQISLRFSSEEEMDPVTPRFIQASLCKIQGLLNDFPTVSKD